MKYGFKAAVLVAAVIVACGAFAQQAQVGKLTLARNLTMAKQSTDRFAAGKTQDAVYDGTRVRTARRGFGEISFSDESVLRLNERTEMVVQNVEALRRMRLQRGALWLRVVKGAGTSIQTPVATATVRGTELAMTAEGECWVIDGEVWYEAGGEGIVVYGGERASIGPDGKPVKESNIDMESTKKDQWWLAIFEMAEQIVMPTSQQLVAMTTATLVIAGSGLDTGTSVPEPGTMVALATGVGAIVASRRKKKRG